MAKITYVHPDGAQDTLDVEVGTSVMMGALMAGIAEIAGECGGNAMCATCHVYVSDVDLARLEATEEIEDEMLDSVAAERTPASRLSCQIQMTESLDGLTVLLPSTQYEG